MYDRQLALCHDNIHAYAQYFIFFIRSYSHYRPTPPSIYHIQTGSCTISLLFACPFPFTSALMEPFRATPLL